MKGPLKSGRSQGRVNGILTSLTVFRFSVRGQASKQRSQCIHVQSAQPGPDALGASRVMLARGRRYAFVRPFG